MSEFANVPRLEQQTRDQASGYSAAAQSVAEVSATNPSAEQLTAELQRFNGCGLGREMQKTASTNQRFELLGRIAELNAQNRTDDPNLPKLDVIVTSIRGGAAGATVFVDKADVWEADWDATGRIRRNICVKD